MLTREQVDRALSESANILSADGERIGSIGQAYVDNDDGQPSWATVKTGLFGMSESFVPLEGARLEGTDIVIPYSKNQVKEAPRIESGRALDPSEEERLYQHYQLEGARTYTDATKDTPNGTTGLGTDRTDAHAADAQAPSAQRTTTGPERTDARATTDTTGYGTTPPATADAQAPSAQRNTTGPDRTDAGATTDTTGPDRTDAGATTDTTGPDRTDAGATTDTTGYGTTPPATSDAQAPSAQRTTTGPERTDARASTDTTGTDARATTDTTGTDRTDARATTDTTGTDRTGTRTTTGPDRTDARAEHETAAPTTEDAVARPRTTPGHGAEQPATGRGRLRKYVTTENVTRTVPVQREEIRIDREPITDENREEELNRPGSDDEREIILHEEQIIVTKESVPVERVRIGTETVTEEVTVNEEVRKEHLGTEGSEDIQGDNG
ncbi:PRC and DUF2382 domain-containing protein [Arthrobacter bambusae]|uniref:PRC and DUF2382 domain-containing protein n=1 Tax=Arthrobacter bambusae TaxID=1338426 RepID=UPI00278805CD|nr:PRC and DUF2382 domain-containing protein [Arthrobacter bambusae]MDQ0213423.1 uncharacterized protein (TIGR02271 family) [Arthrobacter bambusae]MDQ0237723.1 uncharacterized protein (TIGR02271 family) [Arthrobacter bambusae]